MAKRSSLWLSVGVLCMSTVGYQEVRGQRTDVGFAIDRHQDITRTQWNNIIAFLSDMIGALDIEGSRVGVVSFDAHGWLDITLDQYSNMLNLKRAVLALPYWGHGRDISGGLSMLRKHLFVPENGDLFGTSDDVAILVMSGSSGSDFGKTSNEAKLLRQTGTTIFVIGVGPYVNTALMTEITGDLTRTYHLDYFTDLPELTEELVQQIRTIAGISPPASSGTIQMVVIITLSIGIPLVALATIVIVAYMVHKNKKPADPTMTDGVNILDNEESPPSYEEAMTAQNSGRGTNDVDVTNDATTDSPGLSLCTGNDDNVHVTSHEADDRPPTVVSQREGMLSIQSPVDRFHWNYSRLT